MSGLPTPNHARDFVGYGGQPPRAPWPDGAQIAVSIVLSYEEGSEQSVTDGDVRGEALSEVLRAPADGERDLAMESMYEYGSRAGVWRLLELFERQAIPITVYACAVALERNHAVAAYLATSSHEVLAHGYRWEDVTKLGESVEREHIRLAVASLVDGEFEFEAAGRALLTVSRSAFRGLTFKRLERHLDRTQAPRRQFRADHPLPVGRARRVLLGTAAGVSPPGRGDERALIELGQPAEPPDRDGSDG